jgi:pimeloyl-ACP methyl ester carboxylesterase
LAKTVLPNGVRLHHQQVGEGPDVVMIHGLTGNLAVWHLHIVPALMGEFRVLTYDLRGHGYSDTPPSGYTGDDMADDLDLLLDALGIERCTVVGHSFGADTALYHAARRPDRVEQVVAIEAALPAMVARRGREDWPGWDHWVDMLARSGRSIPPEHRADVGYLLRASLELPKKWGPLNGLPRDAARYLRLIDETTVVTDYERVGSLTLDRLGDIEVPVALVFAEDSAFLETHDELFARLPRARSILLPATEWGHFGPLEQPELVAGHIRSAALR